MKKKLITLLLSLILASGTLGNVQGLAAETTEQEVESAQEAETTDQTDDFTHEEEPDEGTDNEDADDEENLENYVQDNYEENVGTFDSDSQTEEDSFEEESADPKEEAVNVLEPEESDVTDESIDAQADINYTGYCGEDVTYALTGTKDNITLTISGDGDMRLGMYSAPWHMNQFDYYENIKKVIIEDGVTSIDAHAFETLINLESIIIPDSVKTIKTCAFRDCNSLKSITIPDGVNSIEWGTFIECGIESITIPDTVKSIESSSFLCCKNLKSIIIPNSVTSIGSGAFNKCESLKSITIPDSVTSIEDGTFSGCTRLESVKIPDSVTSIESEAFSGCGLESITIPNSVTSIGSKAFSGCKLKSIKIPNSVTRIEDETFSGCGRLESITIPNSVTSIGSGAFSGCGFKSITIPDSVTRLENYLFSGSMIESITIPTSVTSIGRFAFKGCKKLKSITIPKSVKRIERFAFQLSSIENVTIEEGLTSIENDIFIECDNLISIPIPNSVTSIDSGLIDKNRCVGTEIIPDPIIITNNPYAIGFAKSKDYLYFNNGAPVITKLSGQNGSDIRVSIQKREDVSGYHIKYADNSNMTNAKEIMLNGKDTSSKVISGLKNGKTYYFRVQAFRKYVGTTYWSKWSQVKSSKVEQTPYPTNVSKLSTFIGSHIKVDWSKTAGASGYHIKYADNSNMTGAKEVMVKGNSTFTKTLTGLTNGKTFYVKIQTYRTVSGKTYWSSWSPAKSIKVDQKPYGSSISKLTNPSSKAMKITWNKAPSATGYHIQYSTNSNMSGVKDIIVNNKDTLSKTVTGLIKGKTYYVRIQTFRKVSGKTYWSSWSKAKQIKITK